MALTKVEAAAAVAGLAGYDAVIDARSPAEFAEDHLPGAVNWPVLDDEERRVVGTLYVQHSPLEARKVGGALVARNIASHLEREMAARPRDWKPLVYCWRGGQRSGSLAWFLSQVGFRTAQLDGGYKAFRGVVRRELEALPARHRFVVIAGRTGSGKTRLLGALAAAGAQVLDLEGQARHRGSLLGALPGMPQPSQKAFETAVWRTLAGFDAARPVFVESESARIGALTVPAALLAALRASRDVVPVQMPDEARVALLLEDYAWLAADAATFARTTEPLVPLRGREVVRRWQALGEQGRWAEAFAALMHEHYDPLYTRSITSHFGALAEAANCELPDGSAASLAAAARELVARHRPFRACRTGSPAPGRNAPRCAPWCGGRRGSSR
jgi:tRNA 2-selenouridine synthase